MDELNARLTKDQRAAQNTRVGLGESHERRGNRAREAGRQARAHIDNDDDVNDPLALRRTSQKLIAAATLLRAMPEPATPEGRTLHQQAQRLVEQAAVQQAESSASRRPQPSAPRGGGNARNDVAESARTPPRAGGSRASYHSPRQRGAEHPDPAPGAQQGRLPVHSRLRDTRNDDGGRGAPKPKEKEADAHRYRPRRGGTLRCPTRSKPVAGTRWHASVQSGNPHGPDPSTVPPAYNTYEVCRGHGS